ncbi:MAG: alpha/beta hydrolase, partial [Chloroflexi bacterium]|nr:alpha/beta hydrolase [Chloroflexota bacterium]
MNRFTKPIAFLLTACMLATLGCRLAQTIAPASISPQSESEVAADVPVDSETITDSPAQAKTQVSGVFFAIHIETSDHASHSNSVAGEWYMLEELVQTADEYGHKLTLEFQPQWAEYALENPDKLAQIRAWEETGHEIAAHHHGVSHAAWDGYTNDPSYQNHARYRGTMDDAMALLNQLPASGQIITSGMTDEESDWPTGVIYATGGMGQSGGGLLSTPSSANYRGQAVIQVDNQGFGLQIGNPASLEEVEQALLQATSDKVVGIVTHPHDFARNPEQFRALFDLLIGFDKETKPVSEILNDNTAGSPAVEDGLPAFDPTSLGTTAKDITYCTANGVSLLMDVYYPTEDNGPWPVTVYVHGGGWVSGDKSKGAGYRFVEVLRKNGYLVASINYRLSPEHQFPAHITDVKCAVRHLRANAALYNLDPERIGAFGGSAGGHLVALLGTSDASSGLEGPGDYQEYSSRVQAVVNLFGPTDDEAFCIPAKIETVFGASSCEDEVITTASPMTHISADDPPFLIFHGDQDDVVPISQSERLHEALSVGGVPSTFITVENAGHGFSRAGDSEVNYHRQSRWLVDNAPRR